MDNNNFPNGFELTVPSTVQTAFSDKTILTEITQDFTLPDYQPEMRKLLRVTPTIQPPSRFLGMGEAEFAGNVNFSVLYLGGDGAPYTVTLSAPYTFRVPLEGDERMVGDRPLSLGIELRTDALQPRLTAPRKLNIRCRLSTHMTGLCDEEIDIRQVGDPCTPETLERSRLCARTAFATGEAMELTDEFSLPAGEGDLRLICSDGMVQITEAICTEEGVACRGELYLKTLVTRDTSLDLTDGTPTPASMESLTRRIPFSQTVELSLPASLAGRDAMAYGLCTDISARVEDDKILCAATVVLEVQAEGNEKVTFVCDCFATDRPSVCEMRTYRYRHALACLNGNVTEGGAVNGNDAGIPQGATPLDLSASAVLTGVSCERGHAILTGDCLYRMLYRTVEGELAHAEFHLPLRYEIPGEGKYADDCTLEADARLTMLNGRIRLEGENNYMVDAEWAIAARLYTKEQIEAVDEARFEGEAEDRRGAYVICYPASDESLWSVAKRYRTPIRTLAALNNLSGAADPASPLSLDGISFLMIG